MRSEGRGENKALRLRKRKGRSGGRRGARGLRSRGRYGFRFLLPELCGVAVFSLLPFIDVMRRSLTGGAGTGRISLSQYRAVLSNEAFRLAVTNTARFTAVCLPLLLGLSFLLALLLSRQRFLKGFFQGAYLLPLAIPAAGIVFLWQVLFDRQGILNGVLTGLSVFGSQGAWFDGAMIGPDWMNTDASFYVLVFSYLWKNLGYDVILWSAGLSAIDPKLYEAARLDGAAERQIFFHITRPLLRPMALTVLMLSFLNTFKVFREAYLVAGSYPQEAMYLLPHVFHNWFQALDVGKMAAASVLLAGVIAGVVCLLTVFHEAGRHGDG